MGLREPAVQGPEGEARVCRCVEQQWGIGMHDATNERPDTDTRSRVRSKALGSR